MLLVLNGSRGGIHRDLLREYSKGLERVEAFDCRPQVDPEVAPRIDSDRHHKHGFDTTEDVGIEGF